VSTTDEERDTEGVPKWDHGILDSRGELADHLQRQLVLVEQRMAEVVRHVAPLLQRMAEDYRDLPPRAKRAVLLLAEQGWYLDPYEPLAKSLWRFEPALYSGDVGAVERSLSRHFTKRLADIEEALCSRFPPRSRIIALAFGAHRRREYELSIPVLLAQADGICKEVAGGYYFIRKNHRPETAPYVQEIADDTLLGAVLSPLAEILPIAASRRNQPTASGGLNRHMILHGDSVDYGTRVNSLKAVSLINYVAMLGPS